MASVQKRATKTGDSWRLMWRNGGRQGRQNSATFTTESAALHWRKLFDTLGADVAWPMLVRAEQEAADKPAAEQAKAVYIRDVVEHHIEHLTGVTDGTRWDYGKDAGRDIYPAIGAIPVELFDETAAARWVNGLSSPVRTVNGVVRGPLSPKSITNRHALLSAALATAVRRKLIASNPAYGLTLPEPSGEDMVFLTHAEWWLLHDAAPQFWRPFLTFLAGTGLRFGEATALQPRDIDLANGRLRVLRAWKKGPRNTTYLGGPKSGAAWRRTVPFSDQVAGLLEEAIHRKDREQLIWVNRRGNQITNKRIHEGVWPGTIAAGRKAGLLAEPRPHDLRHTYASWALQSGDVNIFTLSKTMGHESPSVTQKRYGHLMEENFAAIAAAVNAGLTRP